MDEFDDEMHPVLAFFASWAVAACTVAIGICYWPEIKEDWFILLVVFGWASIPIIGGILLFELMLLKAWIVPLIKWIVKHLRRKPQPVRLYVETEPRPVSVEDNKAYLSALMHRRDHLQALCEQWAKYVVSHGKYELYWTDEFGVTYGSKSSMAEQDIELILEVVKDMIGQYDSEIERVARAVNGSFDVKNTI